MLLISFIVVLMNRSFHLVNNKNLLVYILMLSLILNLNVIEPDNIFLFNNNLLLSCKTNLIYLIILIVSQFLLIELKLDKTQVVFYLVNILSIGIIFLTTETLYLVISLEIFSLSLIGLYFNPSRKLETLWYFFLSGFTTAIIVLNLSNYFILLIGVCLKLGVAPFHQYIPLLYLKKSKPEDEILYLYTITKSLLVLFYRFFDQDWLIGLGVFNVIIGVYNAFLNYENLFAMLVYSSISHIGYYLFALNEFWAFFYLFQNIITTLIVVLWYVESNRISLKKWNLNLVLSLLSFLGLPPLIGFYGKLLVLENLINSNNWWVCLIIITGSCLSAIYYLYWIINLLNSKTLENKTIKSIVFLQFLFLMLIWIDELQDYSIILT